MNLISLGSYSKPFFFFPLYKALHGTFLKDIEISLEKYNIH